MRPAEPARGSGGFNMGNEFARPNTPPAQIARPTQPSRPANPPGNGGGYTRPPNNGGGGYSRPPGNGVGYTRPGNTSRPPGGYPQRPQRPAGGYAPSRPPHTVIANPGYRGGAWGWNGGVHWNPAGGYYGGGFWGGFALAAISAAFYGSIVDAQNQTLDSYEIAPGSPGAQLLQNYGLTQTDCSEDDLVIIYGPDNSLICAYPNQTVGPGNYTVDPTGLTLQSE
jgi:hypothetical protein